MAHGYLTPTPVSGESPISKYLEKKVNELIGKGVKKIENAAKNAFKKTKDTTYRSGRGGVEVAGGYGVGENTAVGGGILGGFKPKGLLPQKAGIVNTQAKVDIFGKNATDINRKEQKYLGTTDPDTAGGPKTRKGGTFTDFGSTPAPEAKPLNAENFFAKAQTGVGDSGEYLTKSQRVADFRKSQEMRTASENTPAISPDSGVDIVAAVNRNTQAIVALSNLTEEQTKSQRSMHNEQQAQSDKLASRALARGEEKALEKGSDRSGFTTPEKFQKLLPGGGGSGGGGGAGGGPGLGIGGKVGAKKVVQAVGKRGAARVGTRLAAKYGGKAAAKAAGKYGGKAAAKLGVKGAAKIGAGAVAKSVGKKIPLVGLGLGAVFAAQRALQGDFVGAGLELASGAASTVPGIGTVGSVGIDAALAARDMGMTPFAKGGIITQPTNALMGEAGKEGVFPLEGKRGRDTFQAMGEGILEAQKKGKREYAELQSLGLKQYFENKGGFKVFGDLFGNIMSGIFGPIIGGLAKGLGNFLGGGLNKLFGTGNGSSMSADEQQLTEALIAGEEGMRTKAYQDSEGIWTIGYGQTQLNGKAVKEGDTISKDEALTGFRGALAEHQQRAINQLGEKRWKAMDAKSRAVLTSLTYNYGSIPDRVLPAAKTGSAEDIAKAMDSLYGDNDGVLKGRRQREQSILRGGTSNRLDKDFMAGGRLAGAGTGPQVMGGNVSSPGAGNGNLAATASAMKGMDTSDGPDGGANGCVYAVNKVFAKAGITPPWGQSKYVPDAESSMQKAGWSQVPYDQAQPGDVMVMKDQKSPPACHIGIMQANGKVLSNSSSNASYTWEDTIEGYNQEYGSQGTLYRMPAGNPATRNAGGGTLTAEQKSQMFQKSGMSALGANTITGATPSPGPISAAPASPQTGTPIMATSAQVASASRVGGGSPTVVNNYYGAGGGKQSGGVNPNGVSAGIDMNAAGLGAFQDLKIRSLT